MTGQIKSLSRWYSSYSETRIPERLDRSWDEVELPHLWEADSPFSEQHRRPRLYARNLRLKEKKEGFYYLHILSAAHSVTCYVNRRRAGTRQGAVSRVSFDITRYLTAERDNYIVLTVDNGAAPCVLPQNLEALTQNGLLGEVFLEYVPAFSFRRNLFGRTAVFCSSQEQDGQDYLHLSAQIQNPPPGSRLGFDLRTQEGEKLMSALLPASEEAALSLPAGKLKALTQEDPAASFRLTASLYAEGRLSDRFTETVGIRQIACRRGALYLNSEKIRLRGLRFTRSRASYNAPYYGLPESKADSAFAFGINLWDIRCCPFNPYFNDEATGSGFALAPALPLTGPLGREIRCLDRAREALQALIYQYYNQPSVLYWTLGFDMPDPLKDEALFARLKNLRALCFDLDPSRPAALILQDVPAPDPRLSELADIYIFSISAAAESYEIAAFRQKIEALKEALPELVLGVEIKDDETQAAGSETVPAAREASEAFLLEEITRGDEAAIVIFSDDTLRRPSEETQDLQFFPGAGEQDYTDRFYLYKAFFSGDDFVHIARSSLPEKAGRAELVLYRGSREAELFINGVSAGHGSGTRRQLYTELPLQSGMNEILARTETKSDRLFYYCAPSESGEA